MIDQIPSTADRVREAPHDVIYPELGIDIVDLGLVYGVRIDGDVAVLDITLTSAACPLPDVIEGQNFQVMDRLVPGHEINRVWPPPWSPALMTPEGRAGHSAGLDHGRRSR